MMSSETAVFYADAGTPVNGSALDEDGPTSLVFGTHETDRESVYAVNFSVALGTPLGAGPSLVKVVVSQPSLLLPPWDS